MKLQDVAIILTGPSGCGKTTTFFPALSKIGQVIDTGDFGKAFLHADWGLVDQVYTPEEALIFFRKQLLKEGLVNYEKSKKAGTGHQICTQLNLLRAVVPNFHALSVKALHRENAPLVTSAINEQEFNELRELYAEVIQVKLNCINPRKREGDNRTPLPLMVSHGLTLTYEFGVTDMEAILLRLTKTLQESLNYFERTINANN